MGKIPLYQLNNGSYASPKGKNLRLSRVSLMPRRWHPFVLCFDELEGLQAYSGDTERLVNFGTFFKELYDFPQCRTLFLSFIHYTYHGHLKQAVNKSVWDVIAQYEGDLKHLEIEEAKRLIIQRMNSVPALKTLRQHHADEQLWPFSNQEVMHIFQEIRRDCTPRQLFYRCRDLFDGRKDVDPWNLEEFLERTWQQRQLQMLSDHDSDPCNGMDFAIPLVLKLLCAGHSQVQNKDLDAVDLIFLSPDQRLVGISFCCLNDKQKLRWRLHWLLKQAQNGRLHSLTVLRNPAKVTSEASNRKLDEISQIENVRVIEPDPVLLAGIRALQRTHQEALNGDLCPDGREIEATELEEWASDVLLSGLDHLLGTIKHLLVDLGLEDALLAAQHRTTTTARS